MSSVKCGCTVALITSTGPLCHKKCYWMSVVFLLALESIFEPPLKYELPCGLRIQISIKLPVVCVVITFKSKLHIA